MKKLLFLLIISSSILSCDKVDCPNEGGCVEPEATCISLAGIDTCQLTGDLVTNESDETTFRKILIYEFTGYQCFNCPEGALEIDNLSSKMGDTLVPISIHSGFYAKPNPPKYVTDFTSDAGDEYEGLFVPIGYPTGVVGMKKFDDAYQHGRSSWETLIRSEINDAPEDIPTIKLNSYYSAETNGLFAKADVKFPVATTVNHSLIFLIVEDHIVDVQLNGSELQTDYDHRHVLRGAIEKALGTKVNSVDALVDEMITVNSDYITLDDSWDLNNCILVGALIDSKTLEVVQVQEMHL